MKRPVPITHQLEDSREMRRSVLHRLNAMRRTLEVRPCPEGRRGELKVELDAITDAMDALSAPERNEKAKQQAEKERILNQLEVEMAWQK